MSVRTIITVLFCLLLSTVHAEGVRDLNLKIPDDYEVPQQEPGVVEPPVQPSQEFEWMNRPAEGPPETCAELMKRYDANKGRPQRRWAIRQYYDKYCRQDGNPGWND